MCVNCEFNSWEIQKSKFCKECACIYCESKPKNSAFDKLCLECITYKFCKCVPKQTNCGKCICQECNKKPQNKDSYYCFDCVCSQCNVNVKNANNIDLICDNCVYNQKEKLSNLAKTYAIMRGMAYFRGRGREQLSDGKRVIRGRGNRGGK